MSYKEKLCMILLVFGLPALFCLCLPVVCALVQSARQRAAAREKAARQRAAQEKKQTAAPALHEVSQSAAVPPAAAQAPRKRGRPRKNPPAQRPEIISSDTPAASSEPQPRLALMQTVRPMFKPEDPISPEDFASRLR